MVYAYEQASTAAELSSSELKEFKRRRRPGGSSRDHTSQLQEVILHWVTTAKRTETRATRFAKKLVEACAAGQRLR